MIDAETFASPSAEWRSVPFWALNDALEPAEIERQLEAFAEGGFGGAYLHSRIGLLTEYLGVNWGPPYAIQVKRAPMGKNGRGRPVTSCVAGPRSPRAAVWPSPLLPSVGSFALPNEFEAATKGEPGASDRAVHTQGEGSRGHHDGGTFGAGHTPCASQRPPFLRCRAGFVASLPVWSMSFPRASPHQAAKRQPSGGRAHPEISLEPRNRGPSYAIPIESAPIRKNGGHANGRQISKWLILQNHSTLSITLSTYIIARDCAPAKMPNHVSVENLGS